MKTKMRNAFGMGQIIAMLLVVLPTMAFIVTLLVDYWSVMQADYKLKIIANKISVFADNRADLRDFSDGKGGSAQDLLDLVNAVNKLCPKGTTLSFGPVTDAAQGEIDITVKYIHNGAYFKNKTLSTSMSTYSYHDQNLSVTATCQ